MTGELADCFVTKTEGVRTILDAVERAAPQREVCVYRTDGYLVSLEEARDDPLSAAASNWRALAAFAGRYIHQGAAVLFDVGSTTTDIVPLVNGSPKPTGLTDTERLICGELVYTGVIRSPVCALVQQVPLRDRQCRVTQEVFATTLDAYLLLGEMPERPADCHTADGKPATKEAAQTRLARMVCADRETFGQDDAVRLARTVQDVQIRLLCEAAGCVLERLDETPVGVLLSGCGEFLAKGIIEHLGVKLEVLSLGERLGAQVSQCAPAHALAVLAREAP